MYIVSVWDYCIIEIILNNIKRNYSTFISYTSARTLYISIILEKSRNQLDIVLCSKHFSIRLGQSLERLWWIQNRYGTCIEGLFKTENYCLYLTKSFDSEISQGELASYFFVYCQKLDFINCRHVYGSRISLSYLRNLPNSAPQWEHLCTQSLALGTQKGMAKHPSHNL